MFGGAGQGHPVPVPLAPGTEADEQTVPAMAWLSLSAMVTPCALIAAIVLAAIDAPVRVLALTAALWVGAVVLMWRARHRRPQRTLLGPPVFALGTWLLAVVLG